MRPISPRAGRTCLRLNQLTQNVRLSDQGNQALGTLGVCEPGKIFKERKKMLK